MNGLRISLLLSLLSSATFGLAQQLANGYQISGQDALVANKKMVLLTSGQPFRALDSTRADASGRFVLAGKLPAPDVYLLRVEPRNSLYPVPLANQQKLMTRFTKSGDSAMDPFSVTFTGSAEAALWAQVWRGKYEKALTGLSADSPLLREFEALLRANTSSFLTPYLTYLCWRNQPDAGRPLLDSLTTVFAREQPASPYLPRLRELLRNAELLKVGALAPDLTLNTLSGKSVSISSLRGKYVLLDFWASWCGPCRAESPNVRAAYEEFQKKGPGFTVYAVSLDDNRAKWEQAVQQDGLPWTQVSDLRGWQSVAAKTYQVMSIPASLLLDPDGRIVAKNLRGQELQRELRQRLR